jgi:hypothetical protein
VIGVLLLLLALGGCTVRSSGSGSGALSISRATEQEITEHTTRWTTLGAEVGEALRLYCQAGSRAERSSMWAVLVQHAAPARISIACPD